MIRSTRFIPALVFACALAATHGCAPFARRDGDQAKLAQFLEAGNEAARAGRYDEAVRHYDSGLALAQSGDAAKYREAAVYLRRFVERAPDEHPLKAPARDTLEHMQNPQGPPVQGRAIAPREPPVQGRVHTIREP